MSAIKYDDGKVKYHYVPGLALEAVARVLTISEKKYPGEQWRKGLDYSRLWDATQRHLQAFWQGTEIDQSGQPHLAHAAANLLMLLEFEEEGREGLDDRPSSADVEEIDYSLASVVARHYRDGRIIPIIYGTRTAEGVAAELEIATEHVADLEDELAIIKDSDND